VFSVAQSCTLSVSPEIVAAREDFFNHGWTRINTDADGLYRDFGIDAPGMLT